PPASCRAAGGACERDCAWFQACPARATDVPSTPEPPAWADAAPAAAWRQKTRSSDENAPASCRRGLGAAMAAAMIYLHEVHEVAGGRMEEFGDAVRTQWRPLVEEDGHARLLWFWHLAHGTGASYQAVSITAVRDWAAWGALVAQAAADARFRDW